MLCHVDGLLRKQTELVCVVTTEEITCRGETNGIYILQYTQNPDAVLHVINRMQL